mmetsp:Transcript_3483/g.4844  ORF Transcript_3483/g.4844 Transcript_3483/m.4844 type:complete len:539 (-) Transcript_3483:169-1785(-)
MTTLFASLRNGTNNADEKSEELETQVSTTFSSRRSFASPAHPPTAIQLYTSKYISFLTGTIVPSSSSSPSTLTSKERLRTKDGNFIENKEASGNSNYVAIMGPKPFEALSYQAVEVGNEGNARPNLGIWDCSLHSATEKNVGLASQLLRGIQIDSSHCQSSSGSQGKDKIDRATFVLTIDMEHAGVVHLHLKAMMDSILSRIKTEGVKFKLESLVFGAAPTEEAKDDNDKQQYNDDSLDNSYYDIVLIAVLPPKTKGDTYVERQAQHLLTYHLRRYASLLDCTLCFVASPFDSLREGTDTSNNNTSTTTKISGPRGISVNQIASIVRKVVIGSHKHKSDKKDDSDGKADTITSNINDDDEDEPNLLQEDSSTKEEDEDGEAQSIFIPGAHDIDVIESVLLRNASCAGNWDATKDTLWEALSTSESMQGNNHNSKQEQTSSDANDSRDVGDEEWLSILADSVKSLIGGTGVFEEEKKKSIITGDDLSSEGGSSVANSSITNGGESKVSDRHLTNTEKKKKKKKKENKDLKNFFQKLRDD